ncbi:MAG: hypothetical protein OJJ54_25000 [Pseudonocardia sp.]|nr:hypothetical protein [Pseudonocardia sp.]
MSNDDGTLDPTASMSAVRRSIMIKSQRGGAYKPRVDVNGYVLPWAEQSEEYRKAHPQPKPIDG